MKTVLFVTYGGGHVNMILPVYQFLSKDPEYNLIIFALTTAGAKLREHGIPYLSYKDFID